MANLVMSKETASSVKKGDRVDVDGKLLEVTSIQRKENGVLTFSFKRTTTQITAASSAKLMVARLGS